MKIIKFSFIVLSIFLLGACSTSKDLTVKIKKGKVVDESSISFVKENIQLKPNEFFQLDDLGLKPNSIKAYSKDYTQLTKLEYVLGRFKKKGLISYDITIKNADYQKPFYGKIAFFNTSKAHELNAVSRYYEIAVGRTYYESATRGRIAIVYEYFEDEVQKAASGLFSLSITTTSVKIPTWVIILSDEPF